MGIETVAMVLQCSGNGRGFFPSKPSGTPWTVGAAGCVVWSGVPLRNVVDAMGGLADGMAFITGTGGEKLPDGVDPKSVVVERSVPIKALPDALLAWELNGAPIALAHGGPLRLVAAGLLGHQQRQVRQASGLHRRGKRREDHVARLSHHAAGRCRPSRASLRCWR